jgi:hypothetical protein
LTEGGDFANPLDQQTCQAHIRSMSQAVQTTDPSLYETDEHLWIEEQIAALRAGRFERLDREHLIAFLEDMARRDIREMRSRLTVLLIHLLKLRHPPERLSRSWITTILEQQAELRHMLKGTPSLRHHVPEALGEAYEDAIRRAAAETGLPPSAFPALSPWTLDEALAYEPR